MVEVQTLKYVVSDVYPGKSICYHHHLIWKVFLKKEEIIEIHTYFEPTYDLLFEFNRY